MAQKVAARAALAELSVATTNYCRMAINARTPLKNRRTLRMVMAPARAGSSAQEKRKARKASEAFDGSVVAMSSFANESPAKEVATHGAYIETVEGAARGAVDYLVNAVVAQHAARGTPKRRRVRARAKARQTKRKGH